MVPLQKELVALEKELSSIETQRKKYFKLYETGNVDDDLFVERLNELRVKHDQFSHRKLEAERQLADSTSEPIPGARSKASNSSSIQNYKSIF